MTVKTKICGVTTVGDAQAAAQAGVDYIGLNFCPRSKRHVSLQRAEAIAECLVARSGGTRLVGVFVNQSHIEIDYILKRLDLDFVQMHGDESTSSVAAYRGRVIKAVFLRSEDDVRRISDFPTDMILVDTPFAPMRLDPSNLMDPFDTVDRVNLQIARDAGYWTLVVETVPADRRA